MSFAVCNLRAERERLLLLISLAGTHTQTANLSESLCQLARQPGQEKSQRGFNSEKKERKKEHTNRKEKEISSQQQQQISANQSFFRRLILTRLFLPSCYFLILIFSPASLFLWLAVQSAPVHRVLSRSLSSFSAD